MSSVKMQGNASGTGILTVTSPNTNSNYTLTLPAATGTLLSNATTTGFPAGSVLQVVTSAPFTTTASTSSTSFVTTGLSVSITPSSTSSKILAIHSDGGSRNSTAGNGMLTTLYRNGTNVVASSGTSPYALNYTQNNSGINVAPTSFVYLDSPASASSVTYTVYFASYNTAGTVYYNTTNFNSFLILMEIAG